MVYNIYIKKKGAINMKNRNVKNSINSVVYFVDLPGNPKAPISVDNEHISKENMDLLIDTLNECRGFIKYLVDTVVHLYDVYDKKFTPTAESLYDGYEHVRDMKKFTASYIKMQKKLKEAGFHAETWRGDLAEEADKKLKRGIE